jgi:hypothetical protein
MKTEAATPPLMDDLSVKEAFADFCVGLNVLNGNFHMTFASVIADHRTDDAPHRRAVSARLVMPITGAIELRDLLTTAIEAVAEVPSASDLLPPARHQQH